MEGWGKRPLPIEAIWPPGRQNKHEGVMKRWEEMFLLANCRWQFDEQPFSLKDKVCSAPLLPPRRKSCSVCSQMRREQMPGDLGFVSSANGKIVTRVPHAQ